MSSIQIGCLYADFLQLVLRDSLTEIKSFMPP